VTRSFVVDGTVALPGGQPTDVRHPQWWARFSRDNALPAVRQIPFDRRRTPQFVCWGRRARGHRARRRTNLDFADSDGVPDVLSIDWGVSLVFTGRTLTRVAEFINETIATVVGRRFAVGFLPRIRVVRGYCD
jgi:hypothetical protein